ncbi:MAG TPA: hypothetical protein VJZ27_06350, partial [Aggregatilineales bacterium]|nr:hypothetical protein [Aggregatilineales bacterium]
MSDEIAGLYVSIGADLSQLELALEETRLRIEDLQAEGGLLGQLPLQVPASVQQMVKGIQTALNPLPPMLQEGLKKPITEVMSWISAYLDEQVNILIAKLYAAARAIHATATALGVPSPVNVDALEGR